MTDRIRAKTVLACRTPDAPRQPVRCRCQCRVRTHTWVGGDPKDPTSWKALPVPVDDLSGTPHRCPCEEESND